MKMRTKIISLIAVIAAASSTLAYAKSNGNMPDPMNAAQHEAAVSACAGKIEGAVIRFDHPMWGAVDAVCAKTPRDNRLHAMPAKMLAHIQVSQVACLGKKEGDAVQMTSMLDSSKQVEATCRKTGDTLAAHPKGMKNNKYRDQMQGM